MRPENGTPEIVRNPINFKLFNDTAFSMILIYFRLFFFLPSTPEFA